MKTACKSTNIRVELARLQVMELHELREKWRELYGKDAPDCGKVFLRKQLAFRIQELRYGGISETAQSVLEKIGETPNCQSEMPWVGLSSGTLRRRRILRRQYEPAGHDQAEG